MWRRTSTSPRRWPKSTSKHFYLKMLVYMRFDDKQEYEHCISGTHSPGDIYESQNCYPPFLNIPTVLIYRYSLQIYWTILIILKLKKFNIPLFLQTIHHRVHHNDFNFVVRLNSEKNVLTKFVLFCPKRTWWINALVL